MRVDAQVDSLVEKVSSISEELARLLSLLPFSDGPDKDKIRSEIRALLREVDRDVREWAEKEMDDAARDHEEDLMFLLPGIAAAINIDHLVSEVSRELRDAVSKATRSVDVYASTLASNSAASRAVKGAINRRSAFSLQGLAASERAAIAKQLRASLDKSFVRVLGRDGKVYQYALDYWVAMQAQMSRGLLRRRISIEMTQAAGYDLVQISTNPSTIGDFCDLYRGKVFSISGEHPFYPPLSSAPNEGTPFHPWCKHVMWPYTSDVENSDLADIPEKYLLLGKSESASINDFQAMWAGDNE